MYSRGEMVLVSTSRDIRLVVREIQTKGERLFCTQGRISVAIELFYRIVYSLYYGRSTISMQIFESIGCLVVGLLDLSEKIAGSSGEVLKIARDTQIKGEYTMDNAGVNKIEIEDRKIIRFIRPEDTVYKEVLGRYILQTQVIICSLIDFDFLFMDLHEVLWKVFEKKDCTERVRRIGWVILTDALSYPFLEYFSPDIIVRTVEYIAEKIGSENKVKITESHDRHEDMIKLEKEILYIYVNNCKLSETIPCTRNKNHLGRGSACGR